jgi:hypothetical protein
LTTAAAFNDIDVKARILPAKTAAVPSEDEEPTCQNTLHACAPLMSIIDDAVAAVRVDPIWNTKRASGLFCPSSTSVPVMPTDEEAV